MKPVPSSLIAVIFIAYGTHAVAFLPEANPVPGGVAVVPLVRSQLEKPQAWFGQRRLLVTQEAGIWYAVIGLGIDQVPGRYIVKFSTDSLRETTHSFNVYTARSSSKKPEDSVEEETEFLDALARRWTQADTVTLPLQSPVLNSATQPYTDNSFFGLAYELPGDKQVHAPAAGTIALLQELEQTGLTLAIDHGQGLISLFFNLDEVLAKSGQTVSPAEVVAIATARDDDNKRTLVWVVLLNGNQINPGILMSRPRSTR